MTAHPSPISLRAQLLLAEAAEKKATQEKLTAANKARAAAVLRNMIQKLQASQVSSTTNCEDDYR
jgi:hypothetical protein